MTNLFVMTLMFIQPNTYIHHMKKKISILGLVIICMILYVGSISAQVTKEQNPSFESPDSQLYKTILHMDSVMFDAFNTHNLEVLKTVFANNLEFYRDKGGLSNYQTTINSFKKVFEATPDLRRELVNGTLEVYPVPGYGAIEMGIHRFIHMENGKQIIGTYKFVHTWQYKDNEWKVTRVVSVGH
jgi:hypothetical protein